jgi:hypothetical protein
MPRDLVQGFAQLVSIAIILVALLFEADLDPPQES